MSAGTVVVGAGLAAAHTIATLRAEGYAQPVTLVGDEPELPYERPALSKAYLQGKAGELAVHDPAFYAGAQVELRIGNRAVAIDRGARRVLLDSGEPVPYEHLVLATGARPRTLAIPGARLPGVHTLRTRADSDRIRDALTRDERWVIIGAGWIGLEVAAAARAAGRSVTVLEYSALPLQRVLGDRLARYFLDLHLGNGVDLRTGCSVRAVERTGSGWAVAVDGDVVDADAVVMAVGVQPNAELAADLGPHGGTGTGGTGSSGSTGGTGGTGGTGSTGSTGSAVGGGIGGIGGIAVDEHLRSADPHVLAAGDVAAAHNTTLGRRLRVEHWDNAIRQGRLAASTILGAGGTYDWQPYFFTDQYDLGMEYVGHNAPGDEVVVRGVLAGGEFVVFWLGGGRVTAAMAVNTWDVAEDLRRLLGREIPARRLADTRIALSDL
jgi:3-phenylpropionate/trans-cinnamate dioxygenase ferredoxin reductase subunit